MCITVDTANLSKTKILSIPVGNGNHFIAYSNSVKNLSGKPNAMILPIPGKTKKDWFYDTTKYNNFLNEIIRKSDLTKNYYGIMSKSMRSSSPSLEEFKVGNYTVALTDSIKDLQLYINSIPENVRPNLSDSLSDFFTKKYKDFSFALCMFDSDKTIDAQPIAFEYTPKNINDIYFPTIDSHDGEAPNLSDLVSTDHTFIYEHTGKQNNKMFKKSVELTSDVPPFLKNRKYRFFESHERGVINGDTFLNSKEVEENSFDITPVIKRGF